MILYSLPGKERAVEAYSSEGALFSGVTRHEGRIGISCMRLEPGGTIGRHPAAVSQLFLLIDGEGWVSGQDGQRYSIRKGQAAYWNAGEEHESGTASGMTVLVAEGHELQIEMEELGSF